MLYDLDTITNIIVLATIIGYVIGTIIKNMKENFEAKQKAREEQLKALYGKMPIDAPDYTPHSFNNPQPVNTIMQQIKTTVENDNLSTNQRITMLKKIIK